MFTENVSVDLSIDNDSWETKQLHKASNMVTGGKNT